jgi:hypothetical protein
MIAQKLYIMFSQETTPSFVATVILSDGTKQTLPNLIKTTDQFSLPIQAAAAAQEHLPQLKRDEDDTTPLPEVVKCEFIIKT